MNNKAHKRAEFTSTYTAEITAVTPVWGTAAGVNSVEKRLRARTEAVIRDGLRELLGADDVVVRDVKVFRRDCE